MLQMPIVGAGDAVLYNGHVLTLRDLPPRYNRRWGDEQRHQLLAAIDGGLISQSEATARYSLGVDDIAGWRDTARADPSTALSPPTPAMQSASPGDRLARLAALLVYRGVIDEADLFSLDLAPPYGPAARNAEFLIDDSPIF